MSDESDESRAQSMSKQKHVWHFQKGGGSSAAPVGPLSGGQLKQLIDQGKVAKGDMLASPTATKNQWVVAESISVIAKSIDAVTQRRKDEKAEAKAEAKAAKKAAPGSQEQAVREHVEKLLVPGEQIEFICMQGKAMMLKRDAVVSTNQRLMMVKPKMLGRFEFIDVMWIDLSDAHVKEGIIGSTFTARSQAGNYKIDNLSKDDARRLYQTAQQREQEARWQRRQLAMEESAAGAMQINIPAAAAPAPAAAPADDPMEKLAKLKKMLEAGLIEQSEFDAKKKQIIDSM